MKNGIIYRFLPAVLCMALALSLTACGGQDKQPADDQTDQATSTLSGPSPAVRGIWMLNPRRRRNWKRKRESSPLPCCATA